MALKGWRMDIIPPHPHYTGGIWKRSFHSENTSDVFRPDYIAEEFRNEITTGHFGFVVEENSVREITQLSWRLHFRKKLRFQNVLRLHKHKKPAFSNSSGLKSVFQKLRFRAGLAWTVGLTGEIKLRFKFSPA